MQHWVLNLACWAPPLRQCSPPSNSFCCLVSGCNGAILKEIPPRHPATDWVHNLMSPALHSDTPSPLAWFNGGRREHHPAHTSCVHLEDPWVRGATARPQSEGERLGCTDASCWNWDNAAFQHTWWRRYQNCCRHQTNLVSQTVSSSKPHYT